MNAEESEGIAEMKKPTFKHCISFLSRIQYTFMETAFHSTLHTSFIAFLPKCSSKDANQFYKSIGFHLSQKDDSLARVVALVELVMSNQNSPAILAIYYEELVQANIRLNEYISAFITQ
jgi:hypothetical protein